MVVHALVLSLSRDPTEITPLTKRAKSSVGYTHVLPGACRQAGHVALPLILRS
jgi:hypothetical protein